MAKFVEYAFFRHILLASGFGRRSRFGRCERLTPWVDTQGTVARALRQRLARQVQALSGAVTKALTSGAMPQRGGVNEGWPGWAKGSNPRRARGLRNDRKHLDPSGSAPLRGGAKEEDLGRIVQSGGTLQARCKVETATQVLERFRGGELTRKACSPSSRGGSTHAMSSPPKGGSACESRQKTRVVCSPSTRVTDRRWRTPSGVACDTDGEGM